MGTCLFCQRHGLFLAVGSDGLCNQCRPGVAVEVQSHLRVIKESLKLADRSKNYKTRLSRCRLALDDSRYLKERYEAGACA